MTEPRTHYAYSAANPFWQSIRRRLRTAAGQYKSPGADTDPGIMRAEVACSMLRETHELHRRPEPAPF